MDDDNNTFDLTGDYNLLLCSVIALVRSRILRPESKQRAEQARGREATEGGER